MVSINESIFIDDFNISEAVYLIKNFNMRLSEKIEAATIRLDLIVMGFCDVKNRIVAYKVKLIPSKKI